MEQDALLQVLPSNCFGINEGAQEMSSPRNESMERADLTMEDWIQETCLISAVT